MGHAVAGEQSGHEAEVERAMILLVIGATGGTGREIVAQALGQGQVVTACARNPAARTTKGCWAALGGQPGQRE